MSEDKEVKVYVPIREKGKRDTEKTRDKESPYRRG